MKRIAIFFAKLLLLLIAGPLVVLTTIEVFLPTGDLNDFQNPLLNAARDGDTVEIQRLLASGSDANTSDAFGNTPLSIAAHFGQTEACELLLKNGAGIDGIRGEMTPLECAVYSDYPDTATFLLQRGADPDRADEYGGTPLAVAAGKGNTDMVKALLDAGADIEVADKHGWRPLHVVLRSTQISDADRLATVKMLLEYGADPNANNSRGFEGDSEHDSHLGYRKTLPNQGNTPVSIAKSNGFTDIVAELTAKGGM